MGHRQSSGRKQPVERADLPALDRRLVPDNDRPGAWFVRVDGTDQSYVDPYDPTWLEFDYIQRIAEIIDSSWPTGQRIAAVHVGGAGMTLPRYIAHTRATSAQIVLEPDASLTAAVRQVAPLAARCGIKVRPVDGRSGMTQLRDQSVDLVLVDAFAGAQVPAELTSLDWFIELRRVTRPAGLVILNLTDSAPFDHSRRVAAGLTDQFGPLVLGAEPSTLKGRRFGNLVLAAGPVLDVDRLRRRAAAAYFPYRLLDGLELDHWLGQAQPFPAGLGLASPTPTDGPTTFR
ncbi:MAG: fused MFS/spermidine synthase [Propionibacteriaceae bacterium]|jgi:spermidine synthase|nr:fused MFS/spermidine synthase [Propionibacteriaceae bacterium]